MSNDNTTLSPFGEIEIPDVNVDANIFNTKKTDYGNVQLFFGQEPGLLDSIHKFYPKLWRLFKKLRKQDWDEEEFDFSLCNVEFKTCPPHVYERMINTLIWQWERALESGRLKPDKRRRKRTMNKQEHDKIKKLEEENELLRIKVAYLEKLEALAQEKKKLQTKTKR